MCEKPATALLSSNPEPGRSWLASLEYCAVPLRLTPALGCALAVATAERYVTAVDGTTPLVLRLLIAPRTWPKSLPPRSAMRGATGGPPAEKRPTPPGCP